MRKRMMGKLRKISTMYYLRQIITYWLVCWMFFGLPAQVAMAATPVVSDAGTATITQGLTNTSVLANQAQTVIEWSNFNTPDDELVAFTQLGTLSNSAVLNRISGSQTLFSGDLTGAGMRIFIVNSSGIVFGPTATVNVAQLVASGLTMTDPDFQDFTDGTITKMKFEGGSGTVTNAGIINATDSAYLVGTQVLNTGSITSPIVVLAAGEKVFLNHLGSNVFIEVADLGTAVPANNTVNNNSGTINATEQVFLAAGDIFSTAISGVDSLAAVANKDITLGNIQAGEITLTADYDDVEGGDVIANGTLTSTTGNIEISASDNTIHINEDVTAEVDLLLNNDTEVAADKKLEAGRNVDLEANKVLKALGNLEIVAGTATSAPDGEILANTAIIDMSTGGTLTLTQNNSLDMTSNFNVDNRSNTDLVATSRVGSVTSAQADEWQSITAHAYTDIVLDDDVGGGDVTTKALTADTKDIVVISDLGKVIATENIIATLGDVSLTADEGIDVTKNITAGGGGDFGGIILDGTVTAVGTDDQKFDAEAGTLWAKDTPGRIATITKPMAAPGKLTLAADTLVDLDGVDGTSGDSVDVQDGALTIDGPVDAEGNLRASGVITLTGPANLAGDVISTGSGIVFDDDVIADGVGYQEFDAGSDWLIAENGADIDKITEGSLTLAGDDGIELGGNVRGSGLTSSDTITFENDVTADGFDDTAAIGGVDASDQRFDADAGALAAMGTITKTAGDDLTLGGGAGLDLDGTVDVLTNRLFIEDDFTAEGDLLAESYVIISDSILTNDEWVNGEFDGVDNQKVEARNAGLRVNTDEYTESDEPYLKKTTDGNLELRSAHSLSLHAHVTVEEGELIINGGTMGSGVSLMGNLWSSGDMTLTSNGGGLGVEGNAESESGSVEMTATGSWIRLYSRSWGRDVTAYENIVLNDDTTVYYSGAILDAGQDVILAFNEDITANYDLTINAGDDIILGALNPAVPGGTGTAGHVTADGHLILTAVDDIYAHGQLISDYGDIEIYSDDSTTYLYTDLVQASGNVLLNNEVELRGTGGNSNQRIDAVNGTMTANKSLDKTTAGNLDIGGGSGIELGGNVYTSDGDLTFEDAVTADGTGPYTNQIFSAGGTGKLTANGSIVKPDTAPGNLSMFGSYDGPVNTTDYSVWTKGVRVENGELDIAGNANVRLDGDIYSSGRMELTSNENTGGSSGFLWHTSGTIESLNDDVDMEAVGNIIALHGGNPTEYVTAGGDILLRSSTHIVANRKLDADDDVVLAAGKSMTPSSGGGVLTLKAGDDIILGIADIATHETTQMVGFGGNILSWGGLTLDAGDDVYAHGTLVASGDIDIYSSDSTTYLWEDVTSDYDVILHNNTEVKAAGKTLKSNYDDVVLAGGKTLDSDYDLTIEAGDDILLGVDPGNHEADPWSGTAGDVETVDYLVLDAEDDIFAYGTLTSTSGSIDLYSSDTSTFLWDDVTAYGDLYMHNTTIVYAPGKTLKSTNDDVILAGGKSLSSSTDLTINAYDDIILGADDPADPLAGGVPSHVLTNNGNLTLIADDADNQGSSGGDIIGYGPLTSFNGTIEARASDDIYLFQNATALDGSIILTADSDNGNWYNSGDLVVKGNLEAGVDIELSASARTIILGGDYIKATGNVLLNDDTELDGSGGQRIEATTGTLTAERDVDKTTSGNLNLAGGSGIILGDDVSTEDGDLIFENAVEAVGTGWSRRDQTFDADGDDKKLDARGSITKITKGNLTLGGGLMTDPGDYEIELDGDVEVQDGSLIIGDGWSDWERKDDTTVAADKTLEASDDVKVYGFLNGEGNLTVRAGDDVKLYDNVDVAGNLDIYASDDTIHLWGDWIEADGDILLGANTEFEGWDDQYVEAGGTLTADGYLRKLNKEWSWCTWTWNYSDGSLYLHADGDISLAGYVQAADKKHICGYEGCGLLSYGGGVSIISDNGMIFTPDGEGDPTDTLNVPVIGRSVDLGGEESIGVRLSSEMDNKAAIVIKSKEDLNLGEGAALTAYGQYDTTGAVDDRAAIGFLDVPDTHIPLDGTLRDEGDPFDVAIYVASTDGDVDVSGPVEILPMMQLVEVEPEPGSEPRGEPEVECVEIPQGTMVIDAWDTVTFDGGVPGGLFETSLADGYVGDRLEVVSRITEWLFEASIYGTLPYPYGGGPFPLDYTYVLRGAGLGNGITDGRAWVLEDPLDAAPLYQETGQAIEPLTLGLEGCPVLLVAVATELGVPGDTIEVSLANSFALNTDIQPCESCARLLNAATILRDEDGSRMAAMTQMFNDMAPGDSPYTPEMQALIVTAFAGAAEGSQYATVMQYTDAFVQYLAVLSTEMGSPVADGDSLAFIMGKYGAGVLGSDNSNIAAFVAARLESGETFGK